jgi:hypothetical protein
VDEHLIATGRLRKLQDAAQLDLGKRATPASGERVRRDPALLVELLSAPLRAGR